MSNLTDLLPAGAGGKQVDFVASGTLSSGQTVILKTNGQVEAISQSIGDITNYTEVQMATNGGTNTYVSAEYDSFNQVVVCLYLQTNSYPTLVAGEISGNTITFGTAVVANSTSAEWPVLGVKNGSFADGKGVVFFVNPSALLTYGQFSVSGTTISVGGFNFSDTINTGYGNALGIGYSPNYDEWLLTYIESYSGYLRGMLVGTGASNPNLGSPVQETGATSPSGYGVSWDTSQTRFLVCMKFSTQKGNAITANSNGSLSLTWGGTYYEYGSTNNKVTEWQRVAYDSVLQKHLVVFSNPDDSDNLYGGVVTLSGNAISFGAETAIYTGSQYGSTQYDVSYDSDQERMFVTFRKNDGPSSQYIFSVVVQLSGTGFTVGTEALLRANNAHFITNTYDSSSQRVISAYEEVGGTNQPFAAVSEIVTSNFASFIGITDAAISNAASGSVTIKGGISTNVTGLTPNQTYYVQSDGTLSTSTSSVLAGKALSATSINLDYTT
jgi:hypothetical protein